MSTPWAHRLMLLLLAAALFSVNIGGYDLWPADEPRYGQVAREMLRTGDYVAPHVNGEPYKEKPPLLFWSIAALSAPLGDVTEWTARLPSVLAALGVLLLTYDLARRLYGSRLALWAGVVLITTWRFWWQARTAQTDMLLTLFTTASLYAFWRWYREDPGRPRARVGWLALLYGGIALGGLTKGPPALLFPVLLALFFFWKNKGEIRKLHPVIGVLGAAAVVLAWFMASRIMAPAEPDTATVSGGMLSELFRQTVGRLLGVSKANPPWYYLETLPVDLLPWAVFLPWTILWVWRNRAQGEAMRLLLSWTVPAFVFFSISIGKRAIYLLPLWPALAILIAASVLALLNSDRPRWRRWIRVAWGGGMTLVALTPHAVLFTNYKAQWGPWMLLWTAVLLGLTAAGLFVTARQFPIIIAVHFCALGTLTALFAFPVIDRYKGASDFCRPLRELTREGVDYRLYSIAFSREEYIFYTDHFHEPVLTEPLDVELEGHTRRELLEAQADVMDAIAEAVEDVPVESFADLQPSERTALAKAIEEAELPEEVSTETATAILEALREREAAFSDEFSADEPAFAFVEEEHWRWMLPLTPRLERFHVLREERVGSREMLMLGNDAGARLLVPENARST